MIGRLKIFAIALAALASPSLLADERGDLLNKINTTHKLTPSQAEAVKKIFDDSSIIGQGNPAITKHPATVEECKAKLNSLKIAFENPEYKKICGAPYMAPLYNPATEKPQDAKACIDQFEYPNIPCEYPVVWIKTSEAADVCSAMGKRLCDAHEWEGGCDGALLEPDYPFEQVKGLPPSPAVGRMRSLHNAKQKQHWAYGDKFAKGICGQNSVKFADCNGGDWKRCGSNTYPTGFFPDCKSKLDVYDQHGNAAEHMNLPLNEGEMASKGSKTLGHTEMKGSWFIWDKYQAHQDYCRWRAPYWHGTRVRDSKSHHNYHLGFRCCKTLP